MLALIQINIQSNGQQNLTRARSGSVICASSQVSVICVTVSVVVIIAMAETPLK